MFNGLDSMIAPTPAGAARRVPGRRRCVVAVLSVIGLATVALATPAAAGAGAGARPAAARAADVQTPVPLPPEPRASAQPARFSSARTTASRAATRTCEPRSTRLDPETGSSLGPATIESRRISLSPVPRATTARRGVRDHQARYPYPRNEPQPGVAGRHGLGPGAHASSQTRTSEPRIPPAIPAVGWARRLQGQWRLGREPERLQFPERRPHARRRDLVRRRRVERETDHDVLPRLVSDRHLELLR